MTIFVLFLLISSYFCQQSEQNIIVCQNEEDFLRLLYNTCIQTFACRTLYHLYPLDASHVSPTPERDSFIDYRNERDFDLFSHQLSRSLIFKYENDTAIVGIERRLVLQGLVPAVWLPQTVVRFDGLTLCYNMTLEPLVAVSVLYSMHIYKIVVADEFFCHDPNERFLLDPITNTSFCICKQGKSCDNESNFDFLMIRLAVILIFAIFIFVLALLISLFYKRYLLNNV